MKTRLSICLRKARYLTLEDAQATADNANITLRPYPCDRCGRFHLTSRTRGKRIARPDGAKALQTFAVDGGKDK